MKTLRYLMVALGVAASIGVCGADTAHFKRIVIRGVPTPPALEYESPLQLEKYQRNMEFFRLLNEDVFTHARAFIEITGAVTLDLYCGFHGDTLDRLQIGELDEMGMEERYKVLKNSLADLLSQDPYRYKQGKMRFLEIGDDEKESCSIGLSVYRVRNYDSAVNSMIK